MRVRRTADGKTSGLQWSGAFQPTLVSRIALEHAPGDEPLDEGAVALSSDGGLIAWAHRDRVAVWRSSTGELRFEARWGPRAPQGLSVALSNDARWLVRGTTSPAQVMVQPLDGSGEPARLSRGAHRLCFSTDGRRLLLADGTRGLWLVEIPSGELVSFVAHDEHLQDVELLPDGTTAVGIDAGGGLLALDLERRSVRVRSKLAVSGPLLGLRGSPNGERLAVRANAELILLRVEPGGFVEERRIAAPAPMPDHYFQQMRASWELGGVEWLRPDLLAVRERISAPSGRQVYAHHHELLLWSSVSGELAARGRSAERISFATAPASGLLAIVTPAAIELLRV